jgi:IclR helix-turn-helix domain
MGAVVAPRRQPGLGAIRQIRRELEQATQERKDVDLRIKRLRTAEAALHGRRSPNAKVLSRDQLIAHLAEHPGSRSMEIADALTVPPTNVRTLLSSLKRAGAVRNQAQRWYLTGGSK